jgi:Domain of unknown function (DUF5348)
MNIAQQAYQDGQEYRKTNGMQVADEVLANRAMEAFTHTGLDFQHWQLYHDNWIAGHQSVADVQQEQAGVVATEGTTYTLVPARKSDRYALDDPQYGCNVTSGDSLALLLNGQWREGSIVHAANLYTIEQAPQRVYSGYYFVDDGGNMHGLCTGMKVRLG